jgi:hypothetical protein
VRLAIVQTLKVAVARERPNHEDYRSFPPGHSSIAFMCAAVVQQNYGKKTAVAAYTVAALIAARSPRRSAGPVPRRRRRRGPAVCRFSAAP